MARTPLRRPAVFPFVNPAPILSSSPGLREGDFWVILDASGNRHRGGIIDGSLMPSPHPFSTKYVDSDGEAHGFNLGLLELVYITSLASTGGSSGTNYVVGDILTLVGGAFGTAATCRVATIGGGGEVETVDTITAGSAYTSYPDDAAATTTDSAAGSGATLDITLEDYTSGRMEPVAYPDGGDTLDRTGISTAGGIVTFVANSVTAPGPRLLLPAVIPRAEMLIIRVNITGTPADFQAVEALLVRVLDTTDMFGVSIGYDGARKIYRPEWANGTLTLGGGTAYAGAITDTQVAHQHNIVGNNVAMVPTVAPWGSSQTAASLRNTTVALSNSATEKYILSIGARATAGEVTVEISEIWVADPPAMGYPS